MTPSEAFEYPAINIIAPKDPSILEYTATIASIAASLATVLALFFAFRGARFAWRQYQLQQNEARQNRIETLESRAKDLMARTIELCVAYPKYAEPTELSSFTKDEYVAYQWFLGAMLNMCEELMRYSSEENWMSEINLILRLHSEHITSDHFFHEDLDSYQNPLREMLLNVRNANLTQNAGMESEA